MSYNKEFFMKALSDYPGEVIGELIRILPDSLIFMSGFFSILASSYPQFVLFASLLESVGIYYILNGLVSLESGTSHYSKQCRSGFQSPTFSSLSFFNRNKSAFPSPPIYITSVATAYILNSLSSQRKELEILGQVYVTRFYLSLAMFSVFLFFLSSYHLYYGCETTPVIIFSMIAGLFVGSLIQMQNFTFFGPNSTNLLSIPLLKNKTATGEQIYICTTRS